MDASKYHMNPQVGKMHEPAPAAVPDPGQQSQGGHVELHGKAPGPFKTMHHMGDGGPPEERTHNSLHDAHHAMNDHVGSDGCSGEGNCEHESVSEQENEGDKPVSNDGDADDEY